MSVALEQCDRCHKVISEIRDMVHFNLFDALNSKILCKSCYLRGAKSPHNISSREDGRIGTFDWHGSDITGKQFASQRDIRMLLGMWGGIKRKSR